MPYKYEIVDQDYSHLASGRVLYSLPGHPAFPVRLASEVLQRCIENRKTIYGNSTRCTLYDPCCGAAYHLSVLAYLHRNHIREILASDIDEKAVELAKRNLGLLTQEGMDRRIDELEAMLERYDKDSHRDALKSAHILKRETPSLELHGPIVTSVFQANATDRGAILAKVPAHSVDILFTDIPYGQHSQWEGTAGIPNPLAAMLDALSGILSASSIIAIGSDKGQKVMHPAYQRVEAFQIGKRRVAILKPN